MKLPSKRKYIGKN